MVSVTPAVAVLVLFTGSVSAEHFRWTGPTGPQTLDPHASTATSELGFLNNVYEGLVRRSKDMRIEPALATHWAPIEDGAGWRFTLRQDVTFHDGSRFDAQDVVFSYQRASAEAADTRSWFASVTDVRIVDDRTIDILTATPDPIFPDRIADWMILDSAWTVVNGALLPDKNNGTYATLNANGTGAFRVTARDPGVRTALEPFDGWWDEAEHNIISAEFIPIRSQATAAAALLSGDVDLIYPVSIQNTARLSTNHAVKIIQGTDARVIMLGFAHQAKNLKYSDMTGTPNPFRDVRVRQAVAHAIDVPAILQTIMQGTGQPANQLVGPAIRGFSPALPARPKHDLDAARNLLMQAGYRDGFSFGLKCPNDQYLNDEAICQTVVSMLEQIGLTAELDAVPVRTYWPALREDKFDMYLLGWRPDAFDAEHPIRFLAATPDDETEIGSWNFGDYSNPRVDALLPMVQSEFDDTKRQAMLDETAAILQSDHAYVPLYVQPLVWAMGTDIELTQRPDNFFILRWVTVN